MDPLAGAQADLRISDSLSATGRMVLRHRPKGGMNESLEWAFVRWHPSPELTLRAGRLGLDVYMVSDYRQVGFAYLWQRPPVEFYGPLFVNSLTGGDASYDLPVSDGVLRAKEFGAADRNSERPSPPRALYLEPGMRVESQRECSAVSAVSPAADIGWGCD